MTSPTRNSPPGEDLGHRGKGGRRPHFFPFFPPNWLFPPRHLTPLFPSPSPRPTSTFASAVRATPSAGVGRGVSGGTGGLPPSAARRRRRSTSVAYASSGGGGMGGSDGYPSSRRERERELRGRRNDLGNYSARAKRRARSRSLDRRRSVSRDRVRAGNFPRERNQQRTEREVVVPLFSLLPLACRAPPP